MGAPMEKYWSSGGIPVPVLMALSTSDDGTADCTGWEESVVEKYWRYLQYSVKNKDYEPE